MKYVLITYDETKLLDDNGDSDVDETHDDSSHTPEIADPKDEFGKDFDIPAFLRKIH